MFAVPVPRFCTWIPVLHVIPCWAPAPGTAAKARTSNNPATTAIFSAFRVFILVVSIIITCEPIFRLPTTDLRATSPLG